MYHIAGKYDDLEFDELCKIKPPKLVLTINNLLADLLICQTFFREMHEKSQFAMHVSLYTRTQVLAIHAHNITYAHSHIYSLTKFLHCYLSMSLRYINYFQT